MRWILFNCCASAEKQSAKSTANRARTKDFFIHGFSLFAFADYLTSDHLPSLDHLVRPVQQRFCGIVTPICFAVLRWMTNSIFATPSTGKSLGLMPVRMRWTYFADRWPTSWLAWAVAGHAALDDRTLVDEHGRQSLDPCRVYDQLIVSLHQRI